MIISFHHKGLKRFFETGDKRGIVAQHADRIAVQLDALDGAVAVTRMDVPGWNLHELKGNRKDTWSIKVSGNRRITFRFRNGNALDVNLEDYH